MSSSKTDSAPQYGPVMRALLQTATPESVAGNTPFLLDREDTCVWIDQGGIELFVVRMQDGRPHGGRRHFATVTRGTLLFGLPADQAPDETGDGGECALLAVPHVDTVIRRLPAHRLRSLAEDAAPDLAAAVDRWVLAVSDGLARSMEPSPVIQHAILPGAPVSVPRDQRFSSTAGVLWLELPPDAASFLDGQPLPPGPQACLFPLGPTSWLHTSRALDAETFTSLELISQGRLWPGLRGLHQVLLPAARTNLIRSERRELERLRRRSGAARRDWVRGLNRLRGVLDCAHADELPVSDDQTPLMQALQVVGRREGFEVRAPAERLSSGRDQATDLRAVLQASGLRSRRVSLRADWARDDSPAMLGFARDDGRPLAILPRAGRGADVVDPTHQRILSDAEALEALSAEAYVITAPLPSTALDWKALPRFTLARGWRDLLTVALTAMVGGLLGMAVPIASSYLIDTVIPGHDKNHLIQVGLILVVLAAATFVMSYVGSLAFSRFQARAGTALQAAIIDRLLRLPVGFFRDFSAGDLAMRAGAITQIDQLISNSVSQALVGSVFALYSFGLLLYYDWRLGLWAVLLTALYAWTSLFLIWMQLRQERRLAQLDGRVQSMTLQLVSGIAKIRLSASEDRAFSRWAALFSGVPGLALAAARPANALATLNAVFSVLPLMVFFLILGKFRGPDEVNVFLLGGLAAFLSAFNNFRDSVTQVTQTIIAILAAQPLLERAMPIMKAVPEVSDDKDDPGELSGAIDVEQVDFRYAAEGPLVLDKVSLSARAGEFIAIVGASGCGKSTLLRLLLGFETTLKGRILLDGRDIKELDILAVRRQMGVVLQNSRLMPGTLYENIAGASDCSLEDVWDAVRKVGLSEDIERMPMGIHTMVTDGGSLSGGQGQRLMLARAIVSRPKILVLDEATSALDNRSQAIVTESLERLSVTRVVVAHRLSTVAKAHRIFVMDAGRVVEQGDYEQLMRMDGHFARLAAAQLV